MTINKKYAALFLLTAVVVAVFWPLLKGKALLHTGLIYTDLWLFNYPIKDWYRGMLMLGQLPFWTSLIGNGYPMLAEGQMGALYPWHLLLFRLFPTLLAFNLNIMLHFLLAGLFTFWFSHISLKMSVRAALLSAFAFIFSGYFVLHIHQINILMVITYLPLSLFLAEKLVKLKMRYLPLMAVTFVMQILAGNIEMFYYSLLITLLYLVLLIIFSPPAESQTGKKNYPVPESPTFQGGDEWWSSWGFRYGVSDFKLKKPRLLSRGVLTGYFLIALIWVILVCNQIYC